MRTQIPISIRLTRSNKTRVVRAMKILIDSGILIEFEKGTRTDLLMTLLAQNHTLYINSTITSEYLYKLLGILAGKSPMSISESKGTRSALSKYQTAAEVSRLFNLIGTF
jgi:predicted nucleic acid-binding protein